MTHSASPWEANDESESDDLDEDSFEPLGVDVMDLNWLAEDGDDTEPEEIDD
jgi:hypothetical protein